MIFITRSFLPPLHSLRRHHRDHTHQGQRQPQGQFNEKEFLRAPLSGLLEPNSTNLVIPSPRLDLLRLGPGARQC